ncbi:shufflon system plasmid conjugative transfer pilus tip adhesin PilV [Dyella ginsengisoli]|uniref:shufflon system plasmid conjugative transfer pilus tip adhesin PilV n=1 Tax=Dyella ginsengisoli TaxID=363848 RepID=UPI000A059D29|nr:shufflon system plasmid conjugative transfer pilus tip adhesin PilV [Dyella ginsengisoli]
MVRKQRGFTLVEMSITLIIIVAAGIALSWFVVKILNQVSDLETAQQDRAVAGQFARYQQAQHDSLLNSASFPVTITAAQVAAAGYPIPTMTNRWGQSYQLWITKDGAGELQGTVFAVGGQTIPSSRVRSIARYITSLGGSGGYIDNKVLTTDSGPSFLQGPNGLNLAMSVYGKSPGVGHYGDAIYLTDAVQQTGLGNTALQRVAVPGQPDLNTMHTDINGGGNSATNFQTINAKYLGAMGLDGASGYPAGWGGGVHTWDLYAEGTIATGSKGTQMATMSSNGNITGVNATLTTDVAVGSWFRTNGDGGIYSNKWGSGIQFADANWVRIYNNKGFYTGGQGQFGSLVANGRLTAQEYIQLNGTANVGWSCSPDGLVGRASDGTGAIQCLGGTWQRMRGMVGEKQVVSGSSSCGNTANTVVAACPANTYVTGGGFLLNAYRPTSTGTSNAPDVSAPSGNGWAVKAGGANGNTCFVSYAVCGS